MRCTEPITAIYSMPLKALPNCSVRAMCRAQPGFLAKKLNDLLGTSTKSVN